jgi:general secretion pathway protein D
MKIIKKILIISLLSVVSLNAEETRNIKSTIDVNKTISSNLMKTVFFHLKHYHSAVIRTKIKPLLGKEAKVISFKFNNMLVLTAYPKSIKIVEKVIKKIEEAKPFDAIIVKFKKTSVEDIHQDINAMSKSLFPQEIQSERVSVIDSNATNSLILVGKKENMNKLLKYIKLLDIEGGFTSSTDSAHIDYSDN